MIGVAIVEVRYGNEKPNLHQHVWMSEGYLYAPVEFVEWIKATQKEQQCTLTIQQWWLKER
jgi:hypothetical protein